MAEPTLAQIAATLDEIKTAVTSRDRSSDGWGWKAFMLVAVLAALVFVVWFVTDEYETASDSAAVLGIVIPVFATVGAAVFGVQVAYERGEKKAEEKASDEVEKATEEASKAKGEAAEAESRAKKLAASALNVVNLLGANDVQVRQTSPAGNDPITELKVRALDILGAD